MWILLVFYRHNLGLTRFTWQYDRSNEDWKHEHMEFHRTCHFSKQTQINKQNEDHDDKKERLINTKNRFLGRSEGKAENSNCDATAFNENRNCILRQSHLSELTRSWTFCFLCEQNEEGTEVFHRPPPIKVQTSIMQRLAISRQLQFPKLSSILIDKFYRYFFFKNKVSN